MKDACLQELNPKIFVTQYVHQIQGIRTCLFHNK